MGISVLNEQLYEAVRKGDVQGVRYALAQGADANGDDRKNKPRLDGTPLMAACSNKESFSLPIVKLLLENGTRVNERKKLGGQTPLMMLGASGNCSEQTLNLLLDAGADINAADTDRSGSGKTFLVSAADYLTPEILELAVRRGAGINQGDCKGKTALMYASEWWVKSFSPDLARSFVLCGADFETKDNDGKRLTDYMGDSTAYLLYIVFCEQGDREMAQRFFSLVKAKSRDTPLKEMFALIRLALMYPEPDRELEKEMKGNREAAFRRLLLTVPDASVSFWSSVLNVVSKGRRSAMQIGQFHRLVKTTVKVLSAVLDYSPDTAIGFIHKRLGPDTLKEWEKGGVEGADELIERLSTIMREQAEDGNVLEAGYVL